MECRPDCRGGPNKLMLLAGARRARMPTGAKQSARAWWESTRLDELGSPGGRGARLIQLGRS